MDFLLELVLTIFFEAPLEATMENRKVKTWVKTVLVLILGGGIYALLAVSGLVPWRDRQELGPTVFMEVLAAGWLILVIWGAIRGHKRGWKQSD